MLKKAILIASLSCASLTHLPAQIIAQWNFEGLTFPSGPTVPSATPNPSAGSLSADVGSGTASALHASSSTVWSTPAGNGSAKSISSTQWAVGDYYQFQVSTVGFSSINIGFMQTSSNTGPSSFKLQYSVDGTTFSDFTTYSVPATSAVPPQTLSWNPSTYQPLSTLYFDLSAVTAINNLPAVYFRITDASTVSINGGTVATAGTGRVDTFTVSQGAVDIAPVPEPGTVALVAVGLGAILFGARRRRA
jgi:hypothetical protein